MPIQLVLVCGAVFHGFPESSTSRRRSLIPVSTAAPAGIWYNTVITRLAITHVYGDYRRGRNDHKSGARGAIRAPQRARSEDIAGREVGRQHRRKRDLSHDR